MNNGSNESALEKRRACFGILFPHLICFTFSLLVNSHQTRRPFITRCRSCRVRMGTLLACSSRLIPDFRAMHVIQQSWTFHKRSPGFGLLRDPPGFTALGTLHVKINTCNLFATYFRVKSPNGCFPNLSRSLWPWTRPWRHVSTPMDKRVKAAWRVETAAAGPAVITTQMSSQWIWQSGAEQDRPLSFSLPMQSEVTLF